MQRILCTVPLYQVSGLQGTVLIQDVYNLAERHSKPGSGNNLRKDSQGLPLTPAWNSLQAEKWEAGVVGTQKHQAKVSQHNFLDIIGKYKYTIYMWRIICTCEQAQIKIEWDIESHIKLHHQACCTYTCLRMAKLFPHMVPPNGGFCAKG